MRSLGHRLNLDLMHAILERQESLGELLVPGTGLEPPSVTAFFVDVGSLWGVRRQKEPDRNRGYY